MCVSLFYIYIPYTHSAKRYNISKRKRREDKKKTNALKEKKSEKNFIQRMYDGCACIYLFIPCTFVIQWQLNYIHVILWSVCLAHCFPRFVWMILRFFFVAFVCRHHWAYHQHFHHLLRKFTDFKSSNQKPFSLKFTWDWTTQQKRKRKKKRNCLNKIMSLHKNGEFSFLASFSLLSFFLSFFPRLQSLSVSMLFLVSARCFITFDSVVHHTFQ